MMYWWLPVGHNWQQCNLKSHRCPCCGSDDETFQHLLSCEQEELRLVREGAIMDLRRLSKKEEIPLLFMTNVISIIRHVADGKPMPTTFPNEQIEKAVQAQEKNGYYNFIVGFLSISWTDALKELGVIQPEFKM